MNWAPIINAFTTVSSGLILAAAMWAVTGMSDGGEAKRDIERYRPLIEEIPLLKATQGVHSQGLADHEGRIRNCERGQCPYRGDRR